MENTKHSPGATAGKSPMAIAQTEESLRVLQLTKITGKVTGMASLPPELLGIIMNCIIEGQMPTF
jgi:hypothetical protein